MNFFKTPEQGAETSIHLASSPSAAGVTGKVRRRPVRAERHMGVSELVCPPSEELTWWLVLLCCCAAVLDGLQGGVVELGVVRRQGSAAVVGRKRRFDGREHGRFGAAAEPRCCGRACGKVSLVRVRVWGVEWCRAPLPWLPWLRHSEPRLARVWAWGCMDLTRM